MKKFKNLAVPPIDKDSDYFIKEAQTAHCTSSAKCVPIGESCIACIYDSNNLPAFAEWYQKQQQL